jgi:hypothetical protein
MKKLLPELTLTGFLVIIFALVFSAKALSATAANVVISEVKTTGGTGLTGHDFVELYNPTDIEINLNGWEVRKRVSTGTESLLFSVSEDLIISAHGFFLWASTDDGFNETVGADIGNGNNIASDNSIILLDSADTEIDKVAWGEGTNQFVETSPFPENPVGSGSIERKACPGSTAENMADGDSANGNAEDTNDNSSDFLLRNVSDPQNSSTETEVPNCDQGSSSPTAAPTDQPTDTPEPTSSPRPTKTQRPVSLPAFTLACRVESRVFRGRFLTITLPRLVCEKILLN